MLVIPFCVFLPNTVCKLNSLFSSAVNININVSRLSKHPQGVAIVLSFVLRLSSFVVKLRYTLPFEYRISNSSFLKLSTNFQALIINLLVLLLYQCRRSQPIIIQLTRDCCSALVIVIVIVIVVFRRGFIVVFRRSHFLYSIKANAQQPLPFRHLKQPPPFLLRGHSRQPFLRADSYADQFKEQFGHCL